MFEVFLFCWEPEKLAHAVGGCLGVGECMFTQKSVRT